MTKTYISEHPTLSMKTKTGKHVGKYVAFLWSSSEPEEWWTADTLEDLRRIVLASNYDVPYTIKSEGNGRYVMGSSLVVYRVDLHPRVVDELA